MASKDLKQKANEIIIKLREIYQDLPEKKRPAFQDYLLDSVYFNQNEFRIGYFQINASLLELKIEETIQIINSLYPGSSKSEANSYLEKHAELAREKGFPEGRFCKRFGAESPHLASHLTAAFYLMLLQAGIINNYEDIRRKEEE